MSLQFIHIVFVEAHGVDWGIEQKVWSEEKNPGDLFDSCIACVPPQNLNKSLMMSTMER